MSYETFMSYETMNQQGKLDNLWHQYKESNSSGLREQIILAYMPLVKKVVGRMGLRPDGPIEWDDLISYGVLGLIDSVERFEPERGIAFQSFASLRIRGSVLDALRQVDPLGRLARRRVRAAQNAIQRLTLELGRTPEDVEVAQAIGLTEAQYSQVLQDANMLILSLDQPVAAVGTVSLELADVLSDPEAEAVLDQVEENELRERLAQSIENLPRREQILLSLYYFEGLTMREVAEVMEISQTRVCQLHARIVLNLKAQMMPLSERELREPRNEEKDEPISPLPERPPAPAPQRPRRKRTRSKKQQLWEELLSLGL